MPEDRLTRVLAALAVPDRHGATARLCAVCAEVTEMTGAGIMLLDHDKPRGSVCTTNDVSELIEELQYTYGEGPCVDAHRQGHSIGEPDLARTSTARWPAFAPPAVEAGARAVFGFPIAIGAARLGALNLYRDQPGELTPAQRADALVVADVAARAVIEMQAGAALGDLGRQLDKGANFRLVVHQASGMAAVQLGIRPAEALVRLRAYAFGHDRVVTDVGRDVVERRLRFDPEDGGLG